MGAWKRRCITYQIVNVSVLVLLALGAARFVTGQIDPPPPIAPARPPLPNDGLRENAFDLAMETIQRIPKRIPGNNFISDGEEALRLSDLLRNPSTGTVRQVEALAQAKKLVKRYTHDVDCLHMLGHVNQGEYLPPRQTSYVSPPAYRSLFRAAHQILLLTGDVAQVEKRRGNDPGYDFTGPGQGYIAALRWAVRVGQNGNAEGRRFGSFLMRDSVHALWPEARTATREDVMTAYFIGRCEEHLTPLTDVLREEAYTGQMARREVFRNPAVLDTLYPHKTERPGWHLPLLYTLCSKRETLDAYTRYMEAEQARARLPYDPAVPRVPPPTDALNRLLLPILPLTKFHDAQDRTQLRLLALGFALGCFQAQTGRYPTTLDELRQFSAPFRRLTITDPFAEWYDPSATFVYRRTETGYVLYSIGPDGRDDGGRAIVLSTRTTTDPYRVFETSRGDIVAGVNF